MRCRRAVQRQRRDRALPLDQYLVAHAPPPADSAAFARRQSKKRSIWVFATLPMSRCPTRASTPRHLHVTLETESRGVAVARERQRPRTPDLGARAGALDGHAVRLRFDHVGDSQRALIRAGDDAHAHGEFDLVAVAAEGGERADAGDARADDARVHERLPESLSRYVEAVCSAQFHRTSSPGAASTIAAPGIRRLTNPHCQIPFPRKAHACAGRKGARGNPKRDHPVEGGGRL